MIKLSVESIRVGLHVKLHWSDSHYDQKTAIIRRIR